MPDPIGGQLKRCLNFALFNFFYGYFHIKIAIDIYIVFILFLLPVFSTSGGRVVTGLQRFKVYKSVVKVYKSVA